MSKIKEDQRHVALCYIRQSVTRDETDTNSPERQRSNIQTICEAKGWTAEWYEDVGGHISGRNERNRPKWLELKKRLTDSDVVALVANDLSRLHRKGWRVGDLIDTLNRHGVALTLAAPGRQQIDTSTQQGRMLVQLGAMFDEYYAEDIAQRARDSVAYRKAKGVTIGMPPFGTHRDAEGYLEPTTEGAWLLENGRFVSGVANQKPEQGVKWRSYYEVAQYILELYASGNRGLEKIAYRLNQEGYPYKNRKGKPRRITRADIRRVVANWPEYGGLVLDKQAKERPAYKQKDVDEIEFVEDRAVFPLKLLREVANIRKERTRKRQSLGLKVKSYPYPLSNITLCAHCERQVQKSNDNSLRTRFTGWGATVGKPIRYTHKTGVSCGCKNRSVPADVYEADFKRLLSLLTVKADSFDVMMELAIQAADNLTL